MSELDNKTYVAFCAWCYEHYATRSARKLTRDVRTMVENNGAPPESEQAWKRLRDYAWAWDVWHDWARDNGHEPLPIPRPEPPKAKRGSKNRNKRLHIALSLPDAAFDALVARLDAAPSTDRCGVALRVIARTGLRVSDLMRVRTEELASAMKRTDGLMRIVVKGRKDVIVSVQGGAEKAWRELHAQTTPRVWDTIAAWLVQEADADTEAGGAAYERLDRYLKMVGSEIAAEERWHIHRLRRTIAMRLIAAGAPIELVRDVLNHSDTRVTKAYTDEKRARAAAEALSLLDK